MSSTLSGLRMKTMVPSLEGKERVSTVQEAIDREKPGRKT